MIELCDKQNQVIVNYVSEFQNSGYGIQKIKRVFLNIKNKINYDPDLETQNASETLVMGYGNNLDKNVLLYTILESMCFKCRLIRLMVRSDCPAFKRNQREFPWYFISVEFLDTVVNLDCSFDKFYMMAFNIISKNNNIDYGPEDYFVEDRRLFRVIKRDIIIDCEENYVNGKLAMANGF
ncbi:hypothetical protein ACER0A_001180 [Haloimpatiens sp. FM7315]|uniref:hypothetical protein n=1 Tax=Haloimpatiens sp. FM7315 TaxID=3298609 RepID=UPI00370C8947